MDRKPEVRMKKKDRRRQLRQRVGTVVLLVAVCCFFGGVFARYLYQRSTDYSQIVADHFYFTADLLGDTQMVPVDGVQGEHYNFTAASTEGSWYLYGASEHRIQIRVQNYYDDLRVTEDAISYRAEVSVKKADGTAIQKTETFPILKKGEENFSSGTLSTLEDGADTAGKAYDDLILDIPAYTEWTYEDGTVVTAKISSEKPYRKTLTLQFVLYATDTALRYKVVDSAGSPYAELIIMTNVNINGDGVQPYLVWSEELSIDNTNPLTYTLGTDGTVTQQAGMENRKMQISKQQKTGESESIYFFKQDTSKNYSKKEMIVTPDSSGTYTITIE